MNEHIEVNLIKEIRFERDGKTIVIPANSIVKLDTENQCGFWNGVFFDLFRDEYALTN